MFGRSMFGNMRDDPFFSHHSSMMQDMDRMMTNFDRSFGMSSMSSMFPAIDNGAPTVQNRAEGRSSNQIQRFGGGMHGSLFGDMFANMDSMMQQMQNSNNAHCYSSTKVMSYSSNGSGEPKYYEATSETTQAPGGVRQTRKSERNSSTGVDKMAVSHHIYDKGHMLERSRNRRTNEREEKQEYMNMDESDKEAFDREWRGKTQQYHRLMGADRNYHRREPRAIDSREYNRENLARQRIGRDRPENNRESDRKVRINSRLEEI